MKKRSELSNTKRPRNSEMMSPATPTPPQLSSVAALSSDWLAESAW
jgi:hypothetical protein